MASLAWILLLVVRRVDHEPIALDQPHSVRPLQIAADKTELQESADYSKPFTGKLMKADFTPTSVKSSNSKLRRSRMSYSRCTGRCRRCVMEMAADALYKAKLICDFYHLAIWKCATLRAVSEAMYAGFQHGITKDDPLRYRRFHAHLYPLIFAGNGIVGPPIPAGDGVSFAQKYLRHKNCTFAMYGDDASNQGQVFEAFNMVRQALGPSTVFVCKNIKYGMGTSAEHSSSNTEYFTQDDKVLSLQMSGMDIITTKRAVIYTRNWTINEWKGPLLLDFVTYRYDGLATEQELEALDKAAKAGVGAAVEAKASLEPLIKDLWNDIYYKGTELPSMRGREREEMHYY
ncbi:dehydrogenase E1 component-domain-containing protein [Crucibulum laeve]|uniref:Dehydrogenase E1 component-domain-containing protein n=1 Tax=Crucibulum laeve TaxID=68775 RepID=A0A5C3M4Q9_9AGAR|nr:dehydrogenase E1 component-domain-containing protein [Crucibulum laeve]